MHCAGAVLVGQLKLECVWARAPIMDVTLVGWLDLEHMEVECVLRQAVPRVLGQTTALVGRLEPVWARGLGLLGCPSRGGRVLGPCLHLY